MTASQERQRPRTVAERVVRIESSIPGVSCPCDHPGVLPRHDVEDAIAVARFDDGDVRYCLPCLQLGYACRMVATRA